MPPQALDVLYSVRGRHDVPSSPPLIFLGVVLSSWHTCGCACARPPTVVSATYGRRPGTWRDYLGYQEAVRFGGVLDTALAMWAVWDRASAVATRYAAAALSPRGAACAWGALACQSVGLRSTAHTSDAPSASPQRSARAAHLGAG